MSANSESYALLLNRVKTRAQLYPRGLQRLGDALWNETDNPQAHTVVRALLPEVIDAELAGEPIVELYPAVKHHLDRCTECAEEYVELLHAELAEERGQLPSAGYLPEPDLSFLPPLKRPFQTIIKEWATEIIKLLAPQDAGDVGLYANSVFARPLIRGVAEERTKYKHVRGDDPQTTLSGRALFEACYASSRAIVVQVRRAQFEAWLTQEKLASEMETRALTTARTLGLDDETAKRFAHAFAAQVIQDPTALRDFIK